MLPLLLNFNKYNLESNHTTLALMSPSDETLTLVFMVVQNLQETVVPSRQERQSTKIKRERDTYPHKLY